VLLGWFGCVGLVSALRIKKKGKKIKMKEKKEKK